MSEDCNDSNNYYRPVTPLERYLDDSARIISDMMLGRGDRIDQARVIAGLGKDSNFDFDTDPLLVPTRASSIDDVFSKLDKLWLRGKYITLEVDSCASSA